MKMRIFIPMENVTLAVVPSISFATVLRLFYFIASHCAMHKHIQIFNANHQIKRSLCFEQGNHLQIYLYDIFHIHQAATQKCYYYL